VLRDGDGDDVIRQPLGLGGEEGQHCDADAESDTHVQVGRRARWHPAGVGCNELTNWQHEVGLSKEQSELP
jgi:hypothetical protein